MKLIIKSKFSFVFIFVFVPLSFLYTQEYSQFKFGKLILENDITVIGEHLEINNGRVSLLVNDQIVVYKLDEIVTIYSGHKENFSLQWFGYGGGTIFMTLIAIGGDFTYYFDITFVSSVIGGVIIGFIVPQIIKLSGPKIIKWQQLDLTNY